MRRRQRVSRTGVCEQRVETDVPTAEIKITDPDPECGDETAIIATATELENADRE
jgi:hypothetical protein